MTTSTKTVKFIDLLNGDPQKYLDNTGSIFSIPAPPSSIENKHILGNFLQKITNYKKNNVSDETFFRGIPNVNETVINSALKFEHKQAGTGTTYYSYVYIKGNKPFWKKSMFEFGTPSSSGTPTGYDYTIGIDYMTPVLGVETSAQDKLPTYLKKDNENNNAIIGELQVMVYNSLGGRKWSAKYKKSINCKRPKGFSQRQHCKYGRKKTRKNRR